MTKNCAFLLLLLLLGVYTATTSAFDITQFEKEIMQKLSQGHPINAELDHFEESMRRVYNRLQELRLLFNQVQANPDLDEGTKIHIAYILTEQLQLAEITQNNIQQKIYQLRDRVRIHNG